MEIIKGEDQNFNFEERLRPLFEAMKDGRMIKSITYSSEDDKNDRSKDIVIQGFIPIKYCVGYDTKSFDYVTGGDSKGALSSFYMNWVISFELY